MSLDARILVVDDDAAQRAPLAGFLADLGAEVLEATNGKAALEVLSGQGADLGITDMRMPEMTGHELLKEARRLNPEIPVILVTAFGTVENAVACLKDGAVDYLLKPLDLDEVEHQVRRALETRHLQRENRELRLRLGEVESVPGIITAGGSMAEALSVVSRVAKSSVSVMLVGESGTGKELFARAIHAAGSRRGAPFVAVNASALSSTLLESELFGHERGAFTGERGAFTGADRPRQGRFEAADGGTLLLDEIGDLPAEAQVKLLRVLQERAVERVGSNRSIPVDVRVIAATHRDLPAEIESGRFREDLFYRLAVVTIEVPPLRRRRADIPLLVEHFIERHAAESGETSRTFSREAMDLLVRYDFPGNVRELENVVQRCLVLARGNQITTDDLPATVLGAADEPRADQVTAPTTLPERVAALEKQAILEALDEDGGNQSKAARTLGISERALRYKLSKFRDAAEPGGEA